MAIGNFGKLIVFETNDSRILNFNNFQRTVTGNWAAHERIGKKPQSEFLNAALQTVAFDIKVNAMHGVRPRDTIEAIANAVEKGQVEPLVVGGRKIGKHHWKILSMSEAWETVLNGGELVKATLSLSLEEYL